MDITHWQDVEPANETSVKAVVRASGLEAVRWTGKPKQHYPPHHHPQAKTLWCASGKITFHIDKRDIYLAPGDRMLLPAGTVHAADAGDEGVVCFEAPPVHDNPSLYD